MRYLTGATFVLLLLAAAGFAYERSVSVPGAPSSVDNSSYPLAAYEVPDAVVVSTTTWTLPGERVSVQESTTPQTVLVLDIGQVPDSRVIVTLLVPRTVDPST